MLKSVKLGKEGSLDKSKNNMLYTDDEKANYICGLVKKDEVKGAEDLISVNKEYTHLSKVDYQIKEIEPEPEPEDDEIIDDNKDYNENSKNDKVDPTKTLSFMNVKSVEEGIEWYRQHNPKIPEDLLPLMARWNWGDLSTITKKQVKNERKKKAKKENKSLQIRRDKTFVVEFN